MCIRDRYDGVGGVEGGAGSYSSYSSHPSHPAPPATREILAVLEAQGLLRHVDGRWFWMAESYPAGGVSLRGAGPGAIAIILGEGGNREGGLETGPETTRVLGTVDRASATWMLHPGAIYLHEGEPYAVERLDLETGNATVRPLSLIHI